MRTALRSQRPAPFIYRVAATDGLTAGTALAFKSRLQIVAAEGGARGEFGVSEEVRLLTPAGTC